MNLESQVCSLELAKRLKELRVKQDSLFKWVEYPHLMKQQEDGTYKCIETRIEILGTSYWRQDEIDIWSAFNVSELGIMLPSSYEKSDDFSSPFCLEIRKYSDLFYIRYYDSDDQWYFDYEVKDSNEANARAQMLIYLLENGLINNE